MNDEDPPSVIPTLWYKFALVLPSNFQYQSILNLANPSSPCFKVLQQCPDLYSSWHYDVMIYFLDAVSDFFSFMILIFSNFTFCWAVITSLASLLTSDDKSIHSESKDDILVRDTLAFERRIHRLVLFQLSFFSKEVTIETSMFSSRCMQRINLTAKLALICFHSSKWAFCRDIGILLS